MAGPTFLQRKLGEITRYYEAFQLAGYPVTLEGNAETLQVARDVDRTNWLTVYGICLEGAAYEAALAAAAAEAEEEFTPNPFAIYLQTTSNARYYMTFAQAGEIIRGLRAWGIAAWSNWNALKDLARGAPDDRALREIDITAGYP